MVDVKGIMNAGVALQSTALLGENLRLAKKKKIKTGDIVSTGMKNIVGVSLIQSQSKIIGGL